MIKCCAALFKVGYTLICLLGCAYQIFHVTNLFFEHHSAVDVSHRLPVQFKLPTISVCFEANKILDTERCSKFNTTLAAQIARVHANRSMTADEKHREIYRLKAAITRLLDINTTNALTASYEEVIESCRVLAPVGSRHSDIYVDCTNVTEVEVYFHHNFKCFTLFKPNANNSKYNHVAEMDKTRAVGEKLLTIKGNFLEQVGK